MSRWIEVDAVKEGLKQNTPQYMWGEVLTTVNVQPYIDLVRCAECIHFTKLSDGWGRCNAHSRTAQTIDFCSWAERKESE